jgi:lipopolysaccharide export system permease protein
MCIFVNIKFYACIVKTLYKFMLKSYVGPFILTLFIAMFVFFMMFIFTYIDDFVGKGISIRILSELFFYFSLTTIQRALPLAILLSSLMTFGNLGEHFELTAMKSSGLSLQKIMTPLIGTTFILSLLAFYFSNNILPYTNLKAGALLYDVRSSKPALMFKDGVFNNSLTGFSIRVEKKGKDGKTLNDVMIYDHREMHGNNFVLSAKTGEMQETPDKTFLVLTLRDGVSYKEMAKDDKDARTHPFIRDKFEERVIRFDLSEFKLSRTNEELFKDNQNMLNIAQLTKMVDSLHTKSVKRKADFPIQLKRSYYNKSFNSVASSKPKEIGGADKHGTIKKNIGDYFSALDKSERLTVIEAATNIARSAKAYVDSVTNDESNDQDSIIRYNIEWHRKFTLSIACLVLFFIGAPLGAIIRKGGLGTPVVISIVFFIIFHVLSITGEKLAKEGSLPAYEGMWVATIALLPVGIFLTYKATSDSDLFDVNLYIEPIKNIFVKKKAKK